MATFVHIPALCASILALMFVGLSVRTLSMRRRLRIAIGDAGNAVMLRAMRVHSNFPEYVHSEEEPPAQGLLLIVFEITLRGTRSSFDSLLTSSRPRSLNRPALPEP